VITPLSCSLVGQEQEIELVPGTRAAELYDGRATRESFYCNYALAPEYEALLAERGLRITGRGPEGEARIVELDDHPFYVGTLFIPQMRSQRGSPHPLVAGFVAAASAAQR
jgi:CTP synthase (UTP-ammonia lyase)